MQNFDPNLEALKIAIKKLFTDSHFSICTIDKLLEMRLIIPNKENYKIMSSVHCVDYKEMSPEFRQWLFNSVVEMFDVDTVEFDLGVVDRMSPVKRFVKLIA
jgi:hypothetical protein